MDALSGPRIEGAGTPESAWQDSRWLAMLATVDAEAWLRGVRRLVVVSPHPDDEVLGCGGLIAHACQTGIEVLIVSVTDGEACYPDDTGWTAARLRAIRRGELERAAACLGVPPACVEVFAIGDGQVAANEDALAAELMRFIAPTDTVLTTWGRDGHPDHEATSRAVRVAVSARGARVVEFPIWAWHWLDPRGETPRIPGAVRLTLSTSACRSKAAALTCFGSQLGTLSPAARDPILPPHVVERFMRGFEVLVA